MTARAGVFSFFAVCLLVASACAEVQPGTSTGGSGGDGGSAGTGGSAATGGQGGLDCSNDFDCADDEYCFAESCGGPGSCVARPVDCSMDEEFVCGCDRETYLNACVASQAGARIESAGKCICTTTDDCISEEYCAAADCDGDGTCEPRPTDCPVIFDPVCGCDDVEYANECEARKAGARVANDGPCPCVDNGDCSPLEYCLGDGCDTEGECRDRPTICPLILDPVCGCDGNTYNNSCNAGAAGVRVASDGACL